MCMPYIHRGTRLALIPSVSGFSKETGRCVTSLCGLVAAKMTICLPDFAGILTAGVMSELIKILCKTYTL